MPTPAQILAGLTSIANDQQWLAIAWHVLLALAFAALLVGWRPSYRVAGVLVAMLPASVAVLAFAYGNPFNGIVFAAATAALVVLAIRESNEDVQRAPRWSSWIGFAVLAYGWTYPHFLHGDPVAYLYAAPVGLVPCATLAVAIGLALQLHGGSRAWKITLASLGAFYGVFGIARLGVLLDVGLLMAAVALAATVVRERQVEKRAAMAVAPHPA